MKKIRLFLIVFVFFVLAGCNSKTFNWDDAVTTLKNNEYVVAQHYDTDEELELINSIAKTEITGLSSYALFDFKYTESITFSIGDDTNNIVVAFSKFENSTQAKSYYDYELATRSEDNEWKYQVVDNILIGSKDENANKILKLSLK